jgi:hypothetical protein
VIYVTINYRYANYYNLSWENLLCNYRLNGFGFMPGKEIKDAGVGNLGLQDRA